jgi:hypothetical protein
MKHMKKRHETFVCRKAENSEFMKCICGRCEAERLRGEVAALKAELETTKLKAAGDRLESEWDLMKEGGRLRAQVEELRNALSACSPAWLPDAVRDNRRRALANTEPKEKTTP